MPLPRRKEKQNYYVTFSITPADTDDPGFAFGFRVGDLDEVERAVMVHYSDPGRLARDAVGYLRGNGYQ